jgi:hypothetical protein
MVKSYNQDPTRNTYYKQYVDMTVEDYVEDRVGSYENFKAYLGNVSSDEGLMPIEFENVPTEGFVLNRKVGGYSNGWDHRATYCRVYDPRGFEFEINVPNLLFILQECNAMKGKGLEGSFVYAWDGKDLVLLPTSSADYQASQEFTKLQSGKVGVKDLVEGCTYKNKQMEDFIYLGKFNWFTDHHKYSEDKYFKSSCFKSHIFVSVDEKAYQRFVPHTALSSFVQKVTDTPVSNYAELLDEFNQSENSFVIKKTDEIDLVIPRQTSSYYSGDNIYLGECFLPIGNDKYEVYDIQAQTDSNRSYYNSKPATIENYTLKSKKLVVLTPNDFQVKAMKPKVVEKISYYDMVNMRLKLLKTNKKNKETLLIF